MNQSIIQPPIFTQEPVVPEPLKKSFPKWSLIALFSFFLGFATVFAYQKYQPTRSVLVGPLPFVSPEPSAETEVADPTAGWETYTNAKYGFSVKYDPNNLPIEIAGTGQQLALISFGTMKNNGFDIEISTGDKLDYYKNQITDHVTETIDKEEKITVNGVVGTKFTFKQVVVIDKFDVAQVIINKNDRDFIITALASDIDNILSTFKFTENQNQLISCSSVNLNLSLNLPNLSWNCEVDNLGKEEKDWDGSIGLSSPIFSIEISSLGRGPYCGDGPQDPNHICTTIPNFIYTPNFALEKFVYDQETKELFGGFNQALQLRPWISVTYKDMSQRELTQNEKNELIELLDSVEIIK